MRVYINISLICLFLSLKAFGDNFLIFRGGVSGGGGNVISPIPPDRYIHPSVAEKIVKKSYDEAQTYFFESERKYRRGLSKEELKFQKIYEILFAGKVDIQKIIKRNFPEIEEHEPCFDFLNQPVDGSISNELEPIVCISAFNLAKKVNLKEMAVQSLALMVHEYAELAGLGEEDAVLLQKQVLLENKK